MAQRPSGRWFADQPHRDWLAWWVGLHALVTLWMTSSIDYGGDIPLNPLILAFVIDWGLRLAPVFVVLVLPFILWRRLWQDRRRGLKG